MIAPTANAPMPSIGIALHLWQRHRRGLSLIAGYIGLLAAAAVLPAHFIRTETFVAFSAIPLGFAALYAMAIFTHPDADIAAPGSGYPSYLMVLPVRTQDLVIWPMAYGAATLSLGWLFVAEFVFRPRGIDAPLFWPAALMAASLASLQALFWAPIQVPYVRIAASVCMLPAVLVAGTLMKASSYPEPFITTLYLSVIPAAYVLALQGVERARRGDSIARSPFPAIATHPDETVRLPARFKSPYRAQVWLEWRRNGLALPLITAISCLAASAPLLWVRDSYPLLKGGILDPIARYFDVEVNVSVRVALVCYILPMVFASILGCGLRKPAGRRQENGLPAFLAVRPLPDLDVVRAKLVMSALSTLATWVIVLAFTALWLSTPARRGSEVGALGAVLIRSGTPAGFVAVIGTVALLVFWTWRNMAQSLFVDITGSVTLAESYRLVLVVGSSIVLFVIAALSTDAAMNTVVDAQIHLLIAIGIVIKIGMTAWAIAQIRHRRLLSDSALWLVSGVWIVAATTVFSALRTFLPSTWVSSTDVASAVILFIPAARLLLAPISLDRARHR